MIDRALLLPLWLIGLIGPAIVAAAELTPIARPDHGPGNITVTDRGRVIISLHPFYDPPFPVAQLENGDLVPFPDHPIWGGAETPLVSVLGLQFDGHDVVWLLDNARLSDAAQPKLVGWDTQSNALHQVVYLAPPIVPADSFVNDLAVDRERATVYIADPAGGPNAALIVIDLATGRARRLLEGHPSVTPESDVALRIDGEPLAIQQPDGSTVQPRVGVNPIALGPRGEWLYFGPMHGSRLYRVRTERLRDMDATSNQIAAGVEDYAPRPVSDGISIDRAGHVYISEIGAHAVGVIEPERRTYRRLIQSPQLSWPDAFSFGPNGTEVYTVANQLHRSPVLNAGVDAAERPFRILTFPGLSPGFVGR